LAVALAGRGDVWRGASGAKPRTEASGFTALDTQLPGGGWPLGALSELLLDAEGVGELQLVLPLLARLTQANRHVALVAPPHIPYAPALAQAGLVLARVVVVDSHRSEGVWAAEQLLRCSAYGAVLAWTPQLREAESRRLQLAAENSGNIGLIYRPTHALGAASVAALRLRLRRRDERLEIEILKARGGLAGKRFFADDMSLAGTSVAARLPAASLV
jgi:hypothetical protein